MQNEAEYPVLYRSESVDVSQQSRLIPNESVDGEVMIVYVVILAQHYITYVWS